jgi:hypothetical protein
MDDRSRDLHSIEPDDEDVDLRVTRSAGPLWTLAGMVRVNRPWRLVLGLRGAVAAGVATAAFGLVSGPVWQVSGVISTERLWIASVVSVMAMVGWLVASLATIGGALGSGLESSDTVRSATWGARYRDSRPIRHNSHN